MKFEKNYLQNIKPEKDIKPEFNKRTAFFLGLALSALQPLAVFSQPQNLDAQEISEIKNNESAKEKNNEIQASMILTIKDFYQQKIEKVNNSLRYIDYREFSESELTLFKREHEESLEKYQNIIDKPEEYYENLHLEIEEIRGFLLQHFQSEEFLTRLKEDYSQDEAQDKQRELINNLESVKIEIDSPEVIKTIIDGHASYSLSKNRVLIPFDDADFEIIAHEFLHGAYRVIEALSKKEIKILRKNFSEDKNINKKNNEYQSSPEERIVRKKLLDLEMERLNIKDYKDKFNDAHYEQLLKFKEEFKLSRAAQDLLKTSTAKQLKNLMNTIAFYDAISENQKEDLKA